MVLALIAVAVAMNEPAVDWELTHTAVAIASEARLDYRIVVMAPQTWREKGIIDAKTWKVGTRLTIYVSPILIAETDADAMRGLLAHELAHPQNRCGPHYRTEAEHAACEREADALAARFVGKRTMLRALCQLMAVSWDWRYTTDVSALIDRIRALHHREDIP